MDFIHFFALRTVIRLSFYRFLTSAYGLIHYSWSSLTSFSSPFVNQLTLEVPLLFKVE
jgi:hypothetical protein